MTDNNKPARRLASFPKQLLIISWKNALLFKQRKAGLICEIIFSCLFMGVFLLMIYFSGPSLIKPRPATNETILFTRYLSSTDKFYYYPNNPFVRSLAKRALQKLVSTSGSPDVDQYLIGVDSPSVEDFDREFKSTVFAMVSFPRGYTDKSGINDTVTYSLYTRDSQYSGYRTNTIFEPRNNFLYTTAPEKFCRQNDYQYTYDKFITVKYAIDLTLISELSGVDFNPNNFLQSKFNCPEYIDDILKSEIGLITPIIISLSYLVTFLLTSSSIIEEKASKMREYLKLIGVKSQAIWMCWMMRAFMVYLIISIVVTTASTVHFTQNYAPTRKALFMFTDPFLVYSMCIVYSFQVTCLAILFGQMFTRGFLAKVVGIVFWLVTMYNFYDGLPSSFKYLFSIFPNSALYFAIQVMFQFERSSKTLDFTALYDNLYNEPQNLGGILAMMIFWSFFYLILSWYIEKISPGEYGVKLPLYFPFLPSYWKDTLSSDYSLANTNELDRADSDFFETDPTDLYGSVKIKKLSKKFRVGFEEKKVVNDISLNFYQDQVTGFLGYNGAGKTTTTFIMCGLYPPSSGTVEIYGQDIRLHMEKVRNLIGYCPQANILFDELTVRHHLKLVCWIKGMTGVEVENEILRISDYVGLRGDLNKKSRELSGGMKRRLSVAMAFIGDTKIIILDEPTSGLDPFNRRSLWELIKRYKSGRTIILTTHYMEEADALSDRIAVMDRGQVKCCGTPVFLKSKFGSGYRLTLTKSPEFNMNKFKSAVRQVTGQDPIVKSEVARELCISIPNELDSNLSKLLTFIESSLNKLGIIDYGISSSTVEEVFLNIGEENRTSGGNNSLQDTEQNRNMFRVLNEESNSYRSSGVALYLQQIKSIFVKRFHMFYRRYVIAILVLLLPMFSQLIILNIIPSTVSVLTELINSITDTRPPPTLSLSIGNYGKQSIPMDIKGSSQSVDPLAYFTSRYGKQIEFFDPIKLNNQSVDDYVFQKRSSSPLNLIDNYFVGFNLEFGPQKADVKGLVYFSTVVYHAAASIVNDMTSFLLAYLTNNPKRSIQSINAPFKYSESTPSDFDPAFFNIINCIEATPFSNIDIIHGILVAFIISVSVMHLMRERKNGSKFLQLLSGTHYSTYWFSNFLFDWIIFLFNISFMTLMLKIVSEMIDDSSNEAVIIGRNSATLGYFFLFMLLSSFSWASLAYLWSFLFKSDIICFLTLFLLLAFSSFFDMTFVYVKFIAGATNAGFPVGDIIDPLRVIFAILFPNVAVKRAIYNLKLQNLDLCVQAINTQANNNLLGNNTRGFDFQEPGIGKFALFNFAGFLGYFVLLILVEESAFGKIWQFLQPLIFKKPPLSIDNRVEEDVKAEQARVNGSSLISKAREEPVLLSEVNKVFRQRGRAFYAVKNLSFGEAPRECFGLLGLNGAGKTTTLKMITGELNPTTGELFLNGHNVKTDRRKAMNNLGFCPQFDYLPEFLTVKQTLNLFANIRGLNPSSVSLIVDNYIKAFDLTEFTTTLVQNLSGGNKRKLSAAIAFIGQPTTVILDEPTSGMDPSARRHLWNVIKHARDAGTTILLTTHSMDECEALCSKLTIMVQGQFQCFGNIQHLKAKYGQGYTLVLKLFTIFDNDYQTALNRNEMAVRNLIAFVQHNIPNSILEDRQQQTLFFHLSGERDFSIAKIFSLIERNKEQLNLETFFLSQTTLEQIFLSFVRKTDNQQMLQALPYYQQNAVNSSNQQVFYQANQQVILNMNPQQRVDTASF